METLNNAEVNQSMNWDELFESFPNERLKDYQSSLRLV